MAVSICLDDYDYDIDDGDDDDNENDDDDDDACKLSLWQLCSGSVES